jgi:hypothetical protein
MVLKLMGAVVRFMQMSPVDAGLLSYFEKS